MRFLQQRSPKFWFRILLKKVNQSEVENHKKAVGAQKITVNDTTQEVDVTKEDVIEEVIEEGDAINKTEEVKPKPSFIQVLEQEIENKRVILLPLSTDLVQSMITDSSYQNEKKQTALNDFKSAVFITTASIVKHGQKQKEALAKLKQTFLSSLYPISPGAMELPDDKSKYFSSKIIENAVKRKKMEEERIVFEKEREKISSSLSISKKKEKKNEMIEPANAAKNAKESWYEALLILSNFPFCDIVEIETRERFDFTRYEEF